MGHSERVMKAKQNGWVNKRSIWIMQAEAYGSQSALETGCNAGALKSTWVPREYPQKMSSLSVLLPQLAVKDISSAWSLNHCHPFNLLWVTLKFDILTFTHREDLPIKKKKKKGVFRSDHQCETEPLPSALLWFYKHRLSREGAFQWVSPLQARSLNPAPYFSNRFRQIVWLLPFSSSHLSWFQFVVWPHMISRFFGQFCNKKDHPEEFQASFYYSSKTTPIERETH